MRITKVTVYGRKFYRKFTLGKCHKMYNSEWVSSTENRLRLTIKGFTCFSLDLYLL